MKNLVTSLIEHERIKTTLPKALEMRRFADKVVHLGIISNQAILFQGKKGKGNDMIAISGIVKTKKAHKKLVNELVPRYKSLTYLILKNLSFRDHGGTFVRITKLDLRKHDKAPMAQIEYINKYKLISNFYLVLLRITKKAKGKLRFKIALIHTFGNLRTKFSPKRKFTSKKK
jgi:large subunit ribosomal protein L17